MPEQTNPSNSKSPCRSGWYGGHIPKEPNDGERAICRDCKKPLVKYGGLFGKWQLDKTKKALKV